MPCPCILAICARHRELLIKCVMKCSCPVSTVLLQPCCNYCTQGEEQALDLGQLMMGFFRRFGSHFNLYTDAVAIGSGGICPKKSVCQFDEDVLAPKLCVQDISTLR